MLAFGPININVTEFSAGDETGILRKKIDKALGAVPEGYEFFILKKSIDARKKPEIFYTYTLGISIKNEEKYLKRDRTGKLTRLSRENYAKDGLQALLTKASACMEESGPKKEKDTECVGGTHKNISLNRPVVVGFGPAGMMAAFALAKMGLCPMVIERGSVIDKRSREVEAYWNGGPLNVRTNVQFGEGGAGAFSDGKLNTGNKDKDGLQGLVLRILIDHGAPPEIAYINKPHIGTDVLAIVVKNIRESIKKMGGEFYFDTQMVDVVLSQGEERSLQGIVVEDISGVTKEIPTESLYLAIGHSARDTFRMMKKRGFTLTPKAFAVGYRVAHPQHIINIDRYGEGYEKKSLPPSDYKLTYQAPSGRGVYSFCMCPGGYIVNASSDNGALAVNGMSYSRRDGAYANSAIVVSVTPEDISRYFSAGNISAGDNVLELSGPEAHPLSGMYFQEMVEKRAYKLVKGAIPYETLGTALGERGKDKDEQIVEKTLKDLTKIFQGRAVYTPGFVRENTVLPEDINKDFLSAMKYFGTRIQGFSAENTIIAPVESRTSSPVRIVRNQHYEALGIKGIYPCGEGAGYAGGIMSAAVDALRAVEMAHN